MGCWNGSPVEQLVEHSWDGPSFRGHTGVEFKVKKSKPFRENRDDREILCKWTDTVFVYQRAFNQDIQKIERLCVCVCIPPGFLTFRLFLTLIMPSIHLSLSVSLTLLVTSLSVHLWLSQGYVRLQQIVQCLVFLQGSVPIFWKRLKFYIFSENSKTFVFLDCSNFGQ